MHQHLETPLWEFISLLNRALRYQQNYRITEILTNNVFHLTLNMLIILCRLERRAQKSLSVKYVPRSSLPASTRPPLLRHAQRYLFTFFKLTVFVAKAFFHSSLFDNIYLQCLFNFNYTQRDINPCFGQLQFIQFQTKESFCYGYQTMDETFKIRS